MTLYEQLEKILVLGIYVRINEEVQDVPKVIDTFHPTGTGTEVDRKSIAVQEVHGEFAESMELNF